MRRIRNDRTWSVHAHQCELCTYVRIVLTGKKRPTMFRSHLLRRPYLGLSHSAIVRAVLTNATTTAGRQSESQRQRGSHLASQTAEGELPRPEPPTATRRSVYTISGEAFSP